MENVRLWRGSWWMRMDVGFMRCHDARGTDESRCGRYSYFFSQW